MSGASKVDEGFWTHAAAVVPAAVAPTVARAEEKVVIHRIQKFSQIEAHIRRKHESLRVSLNLSEEEFVKLVFGKITICLDHDDCFAMHDGTIAAFEPNLPGGKDSRSRGPIVEVNDKSLRLCDAECLTVLKSLRLKGARIIFVTSRRASEHEETVAEIKALGYPDPVVWCTSKTPKGPFVRKELARLAEGKGSGLDGGEIVAVDDMDGPVFLGSYVGPDAFPADRVTHLQYETFEQSPEETA
ncbi:MAG: hypothetical protein Hyperionvirus15_38 [Hyperionvirus sp.]|uniref:Uncharacterized protein n=1 Tax=Hyperionvirus sp. TaxID=2487770 RepID=A0A3G5A9T1_9VIRU|nr:MAG: hypothetical protein Hyperionvirus15_38 [Hyperionvirus sp.]